MSIKEGLRRLSRVAGVRLRQIVTGSKKFQMGTLDHNYKPDFSEYINSSSEGMEHTSRPVSPVFTMASSQESSAVFERLNQKLDGNLLPFTS
jgi:hypothetical protein